jgi:hypothetical protein
MRGALICVLAVAVVLPAACASASSSPSSAPRAVAPTSQQAAPTSQDRVRKPITVTVGKRLFGLHDGSMDSLAKPGVGALRLWDSGVMWKYVQPSAPPAAYDWARLDQYVEEAHAHGTELTLVLGGTPAWAAADPAKATYLDPPTSAAFRAYVTAVMKRYKSFVPPGAPAGTTPYRGIANYQVWNEANIKTFWTGSLQDVADMTKTVWQVRQSVDRGAKVIAPSMVVRMAYQMKAAKAFYRLKAGGKPVWKYVDATGFSLYPVDAIKRRPAGPEDSMNLLRSLRSILARDNVPARLPLWNTEINYGYRTGAQGNDPAAPISDTRQAAYVLRTYLLNAAAGLQRVFWYRYDGTDPRANTHLVETSDPSVLTPAGHAFYRVQKWIKGATLVGTPTARPCTKDRHGTYTCVVRYGKSSMGRIYWNPNKTVKKRTVKSTRSTETGLGVVRTVGHRVTLKVDYLPVLVRSRH